MINKYVAKTLFDGYKINQKTSKKYVAVPEKQVKHTCLVYFLHEYMKIEKGAKPVYKEVFEDKFGRKPYTMLYFAWKPYIKKEKQESLRFDIQNTYTSLSEEQRKKIRSFIRKIKRT